MDFTSRYCRRRMENAVTCPSSSLGINWFQFGFCMPTIPAIDFPISLHPDWMGNLVQSRPDVSLGSMVIPGSHDAGSYSIDSFKLFSAVGRNQNVSVLDQLHRGARFLDIKLGESGKSVNVFSGCMQGAKLDRIVEEIKLFCEDFPGEFVVIELSAEAGRTFSSAKKLSALESVKEMFGEKMYAEDDVSKLLSTPIKDLVMGGKQICVLLGPRFMLDLELDGKPVTDEYLCETYSCFLSDKWMENKFNNTRNIDDMLDLNLEEVKEESKKGKLLNNQFILTPGVGGAPDVAKLLFGMNSLQPVYLANNLYKPPKRHASPPLHTFFQEHGTENWNLVSLDFVDLCPAMMGFLVGLNFTEFEIMLATVQYGNPNFFRPSMSVTQKVQSHVVRNRVLFLNVGKDFGSNFGTLTLAYRVHDKFYSIVIHFDGSSVIVLNEYNHLQAGSKEIVVDDDAEEGSINPGGGGTLMTWCRSEEGDDIEFDFDSPF